MPVNKRASLPGANELFRPTREGGPTQQVSPKSDPVSPEQASPEKPQPTPAQPPATGRVRHDQKITVYFSSEELFALEDATLELKRRHGLRLDRGRLVRTAVALALRDLAEHGADSSVISELTEQ